MNMTEERIIDKASKYKKLLETYELYPYSYLINNKYFYFVSFQRFNKSTGMVIIADSKNYTDQEIISAFKMIYNFNRIMREALDQMIPDIKKPVSVLQEMQILLTEVESMTGSTLKKSENEVKNLNFMINEVVGFPDKLVEILKEMKAIEKTVLDRKYLLSDDVDRMMELNFLHCKIMYSQGREQLKGIEDAQVIVRRLKEQIDDFSDSQKKKIKQLIYYLEVFSEERAIRDLNKSQATFEKDEFGNKITIAPGEAGMEEYKQIHYKAVDNILEDHIKNHLRNFK
ncbi:hypothetical protein ABID52_003896 [Fictibacillus halophilus]|uniref:Uncharacterized protein n=1 Tax=Fictibacillus halophilus TaxID=1610490 RepID=A0ABV2LNW0_9BACL|nr:hypothetical protein [Fictibacillus halophilus]